MRKLMFAVLPMVGCLMGAQAAGAATLLPFPAMVDGGNVTLVDGGCGGPEFFRAPNGVCYHKRPHYGPPPGYYHHYRACPPGLHPTPYGCRPNY